MIRDVRPNGWVWMFYAERTDWFIQIGVGPLLIWRDRDWDWWKWRVAFNPD